MTLASSLAALKSSLDQGNEQFTNKHFRLIIEALESIQTGDIAAGGFLQLGAPPELTIASGVVTATQTHHRIDTENDDATDDLDTIDGGSNGDLLIIRPSSTARTVVVKSGTGNVRLDGSSDFSMDSSSDMLGLLKNDVGVWSELFRSSNGS